MAGFTNRGKLRVLQAYLQNQNVPTTFYIALCTSAPAPTADTNTMADLTEVTAGNGYTAGGISLARNTTDFDVATEDDAADRALVQLKDIVWTAAGGNLPSGSGARWAVLTDDNATLSARVVIAFWDLTSDRVVSSGQTMTLQNCELRLTE